MTEPSAEGSVIWWWQLNALDLVYTGKWSQFCDAPKERNGGLEGRWLKKGVLALNAEMATTEYPTLHVAFYAKDSASISIWNVMEKLR